MKLITNFDIAAKEENDLRGLFAKLSKELAMSGQGSPERRNTLASMENVEREIAVVHAQGMRM